MVTATPYGGVAQLGEHLPCKQGVMGSNPIISTREAPRGRYGYDSEGLKFSVECDVRIKTE